MTKDKVKRIRRFSRSDRFQHWGLVISFTILALTGLVQKYSGAELSKGLIGLMGGIESVRIIHRVSAVVLMLVSVYHLGVIAYGLYVQRKLPKMIPSPQDVKDAWQSLRYSLGREKKHPEFDRYSFGEKFEYWAVVWGMLVMIMTGFMLWNPIATTNFLPGEVIPAAKSAHGNEALLAVIAIIIWHFYNVLVRHFNKSMFTGFLSRKEMEEHHSLELKEIDGPAGSPPELASVVEKRRSVFLPVYGVVAAVLLFGIYQFVTFEQTALDLDVVVPSEPLESITAIRPTVVVDESALADLSLPADFEPIDLMWPESAHTDEGALAFRNWDADDQVSPACSKCHSELGLATLIETGQAGVQSVSAGLTCDTCHANTTSYELRDVESLEFPSGISVQNGEAKITLCATCHLGRSSADSVRVSDELGAQDEISASIQMVDLHAPPAAGSFFGSLSQMAFEYEGKNYMGQNSHIEAYSTCADCHTPHDFQPTGELCAQCHEEIEGSLDYHDIRFGIVDYDGDGDIEEGIAFEIDGLEAALLAAIQTYAQDLTQTGIAYDGNHYPYFYIDSNGNGIVDGSELDGNNTFDNWTSRLVKAAYNYHFSQFDGGGFAHNPDYMLQLLYDSLDDLGADVAGFERP